MPGSAIFRLEPASVQAYRVPVHPNFVFFAGLYVDFYAVVNNNGNIFFSKTDVEIVENEVKQLRTK